MEGNVLPDRYVNAAEAALFLGLSEGTIRNMAYRRELPSVKFGTRLRFRLSALAAWAEEQDHRPAADNCSGADGTDDLVGDALAS